MPRLPLIKKRRPLSKDGTTWPSRSRHFKWSVLLDFLVITTLLLLSLAFYKFIYPTERYFRIDDPELMWPRAPVLVSSPLVGAVSFFLPASIILLANIFFWWNKWDLYSGLVGLLFAWTVSLFFTGLLWVIVGEVRPHFLSKCDIDISRVSTNTLFYTRDICRNNDKITPDDLHSFPSGHGSGAFVGMVFLMCYLNGKLKVFNGHGGHTWKFLVAFVLPLTLAFYLSLRRLADHSHTGTQMLIGILIGVFSALAAYRLFYRSGFWFGHGEDSHISTVQWARENSRFEQVGDTGYENSTNS